jgi:hypothetical protein
VWYKRDTSQLSQFSKEEVDKIYEIMLNYSYPCYLSGSEVVKQLSSEEKTKLLQHELLFIEEKMAQAGLSHIIMMQIPRALYDLFNLYFTFKYTQTDISAIPNFYYQCSITIAKMTEHNALTREYTDYVKDNIFALNAFIVNYFQIKYSMSASAIRESYDKITDELVAECWLTLEADTSITHNLELGIMFKYMPLEEAKKIVRQTIHFEKQYSQGRAILYRGAANEMDSLIDLSKESLSFYSISFNLSIFTGCVVDNGACTMSYFSKPKISFNMSKTINDKIKFNFKKFLFDDSSVDNSLFFIPPIHPYVQMYSSGELFHARTKIGIDYIDKFNKFKDKYPRDDFVKGLFDCQPNEKEFIQRCDYLKSKETHEELNALYQRYKTTSVIGTWSSDSATQSKQEKFMETRSATVKETALRASMLPQNAFKIVGNRWKKVEAINGEIKFKILEDYYPQLRRRIRFMISNFMSKYLHSICPQASVETSYKYHDDERSYYRGVEFPSVTFHFESKGDFEKCKSKLPLPPMLSLSLEPKSLILSLNSINIRSLFEGSWNFRGSELYKEHEEIRRMKFVLENIGYFLGEHSFIEKRRDNDIEYKNNLNTYFIFMSEIFPKLQEQIGGKGKTRRRTLKRSIRNKKQFKSKYKTMTRTKNKTKKH